MRNKVEELVKKYEKSILLYTEMIERQEKRNEIIEESLHESIRTKGAKTIQAHAERLAEGINELSRLRFEMGQEVKFKKELDSILKGSD